MYIYIFTCTCTYMHIHVYTYMSMLQTPTRHWNTYGVALVSRIDKIVGLFCKRAPQKRQYSAKETYNFIDPTDRSHPIPPPQLLRRKLITKHKNTKVHGDTQRCAQILKCHLPWRTLIYSGHGCSFRSLFQFKCLCTRQQPKKARRAKENELSLL